MKKYLIFIIILINFYLLAQTSVSITPNIVYQGGTFAIDLHTDLDFDDSKIFFMKKYYNFYPRTKDQYRTVLGIPYNGSTGSHEIFIKLYKNSQIIFSEKLLTEILPGNFKKSVLIISDQKIKKGATDWKTLAKENSLLSKAYQKQTLGKYWQNNFIVPIENYKKISSPFGSQRTYKDVSGNVLSYWSHKGVDYSAESGHPVMAANEGIIVLSKVMKVHGTTLAIDHGQGVISLYNHLSARFVKPGEKVIKGQIIGTVGNSGLTTGAHLHYGLSVNNVRIDPHEWYRKSF